MRDIPGIPTCSTKTTAPSTAGEQTRQNTTQQQVRTQNFPVQCHPPKRKRRKKQNPFGTGIGYKKWTPTAKGTTTATGTVTLLFQLVVSLG